MRIFCVACSANCTDADSTVTHLSRGMDGARATWPKIWEKRTYGLAGRLSDPAGDALRSAGARSRRRARRRRARAGPRVERCRADRAFGGEPDGPEPPTSCCSTILITEWSADPKKSRGSTLTGSTACSPLVRRCARPIAAAVGAGASLVGMKPPISHVFRPRPEQPHERDLVWVGNWGDEERSAELRDFLIEPVATLGLIGARARRALSGRSADRAGCAPASTIRLSAEFLCAAKPSPRRA